MKSIDKKPLLSIITVCLNEKNRIKKTLDSIFGQTYSMYESIVIDGGSVDGTKELIEREYLCRLSCFISEKDDGIYDAMNKGIVKSRGEYLLFLNAGDYLVDENVLLNAFSYDLIEDIIIFDLTIKKSRNESFIHSLCQYKINKRFCYHKALPHPSTFFKRELFIKYGYYDKKLKIVGDHELEMRFLTKSNVKLKCIPLVLSVFSLDGISANINNLRIIQKETMLARRSNYPFYERIVFEFLNALDNKILRLLKI